MIDNMTNNSSIAVEKGGNQLTPEQRKEELTKCILSQYRLCAAGTIGGAGFSVLRSQSVRPTAWPMLGGAFVGTLGDFVYGYFVECASLRTGGDSLVGSNNDKKS
uniref:Uncharacterized protein n=1 Tax=Skeletonema marinoi TaxID=267567 RepID=A0A7S1CRT8_9STRA|mmetsp:Transcript_18016/g.27435  ORF Transcript_18016/g.27435 Transcript_18016/m.27435 type:complete len:105 (+) Transcript_18016:62-376(+)